MNVEKLKTAKFLPYVPPRMHRTRISDLDGLLNGGYPQGRLTLIEGTGDKETWDDVWWNFISRYDSDECEWWYDLKEDGKEVFQSTKPRVVFIPDIYFKKDPEDWESIKFLSPLLPRLRSLCTKRNVALVGFSNVPATSKALRFYASVRLSVRKTDIGYETRILKSTVSAGGGSVLQHGD